MAAKKFPTNLHAKEHELCVPIMPIIVQLKNGQNKSESKYYITQLNLTFGSAIALLVCLRTADNTTIVSMCECAYTSLFEYRMKTKQVTVVDYCKLRLSLLKKRGFWAWMRLKKKIYYRCAHEYLLINNMQIIVTLYNMVVV